MKNELENLIALGFRDEADCDEHQRVMRASKELGEKQKADSIAAGSTAFTSPEKMPVNANTHLAGINEQRFTVSNDGLTVSDQVTNLMWDRKASALPVVWQAAQDIAIAANKTSHLGYNDWRVPSLSEQESLKILGEPSSQKPARSLALIDEKAFPGTPVFWFWTSLQELSNPNVGWIVHSGTLSSTIDGKGGESYVRLVRGPVEVA